MSYIRGAYPNAFRGQTESDIVHMVQTWHDLLKDFEWPIVRKAIRQYIKDSKSEYPPSLSQLYGLCDEIAERWDFPIFLDSEEELTPDA